VAEETQPVETQTPSPATAPAPATPTRRSRAEIAAELFGSDYKGKVEEAKPQEKELAAQPDKEAPKVPVEEPPSEGEGEAPKPEEEKPAPAEDTGERPIETVSELAQHLEADPEWINTLKVAVKVDGRQAEVPLGDLIASYQKQEMADQYLKEARDAKHSTTQELAEKRNALESEYRVAADLVKSVEATLERDVKAIDPKLRDEDPAEWAARIQEFNQRRANIERMKYETVEGYKTAMQTQAAEAGRIRDEFRTQQNALLLEKLPEWQDPKRADDEKVKLTDYAFRVGFTQPELANLLDHRQVLILRKAMLYDESRGQVDTARKRVASVPKIMKPGAPKPREQLAAEKLQGLKAKLEKSGSLDDALAYRMAKRGVSR
jgi:hypothetical protein